MNYFRNLSTITLFGLLFLGLVVRLYNFNAPIADWHSWRQTDTSAVSKNFIANGFDILHPQYFDVSNIQSGIDNPKGYRMVEFPLYNFFQAGLYKIFNLFTLEEWGRLVSIISSLFTSVVLFLLLKKYLDIKTGLLASFFYLFLPFSIFYSRTVLPDTMMIATLMGGIYFFDRWIEESSKFKNPVKDETRILRQNAKLQFNIGNYLHLLLALIFIASSLLLKPYAIFFTLPLIYIAFKHFKLEAFKKWELWIFALGSMLPFIVWRYWISQFPEGIPAYDWLFNKDNIRFTGAYFYWIVGDRLSTQILGYLGVVLFTLGIFKLSKEKNYFFLITFFISSLIYLVIIAGGNVQHDYYQILIIPTVTIFLARGVTFLVENTTSFNRKILYLLLPIIMVLMLMFSFYFVREKYRTNDVLVRVGKEADRILPKDAKVIAPRDGDTTFLYYINRPGWPAFQKSTEELMVMGATHVVLLNPQEEDVQNYAKKYTLLRKTPDFVIVELRAL